MALFPGHDPDEQVILFTRRHWLILFRHGLLIALLATLPFLARWVIHYYAPDVLVDDGTLRSVLLRLAAYVYWMFVALFAFATWIDYYLDYWVITDRRIVSVEQAGLFSRTIAQVSLGRVQDATSQMRGVWATVFHFGEVFIQSAGEEARFVFTQVPNPNGVVTTVMDLHQKNLPDQSAGKKDTDAPADV